MYQPMSQNAFPLSYNSQIGPTPGNLASFKQHKTAVSSFDPPTSFINN